MAVRKVNPDAMLQYINETGKYALHIFDKAPEICSGISADFKEHQYKRILLVGSGTSNNACLAARDFMRAVLKTPVEVYTSYDYAHYNTLFLKDDIAIFVSNEGESTNTIDAINTAKKNGVRTYIVTEAAKNTCTLTADAKVVLDCGFEYFGPKTKGYTCSVLTLYMIALETAKAMDRVSDAEYEHYRETCRNSLSRIPSIIDASEEFISKNREELIGCERAYVVGYGPHVATALEGSLKCLETVRYFYFSFEAEEFLHGPLASVKDDVYTFIINPKNGDHERCEAIYKGMSRTNSHVFNITSEKDDQDPHVFCGPFTDDEYMSVFEYIIFFQLLAYRTFTGKGIDLNVRNYPKFSNTVPTKAKSLDVKIPE